MTIKHLVLSGGGPIMITMLSAIEELENNNFLHINEIESIYGTSAGAIIAVMIALKYDWETLNDYIIKRPWQDVFPVKPQDIIDIYQKKGLFDIKTVEKCFKPLFDAKDIPIDINLEDFYELTKIELHMFTFEINEYKLHDISYKTYPKTSVLKAIHMSSSIPIFLTPVCIDNMCFMDGGVGCNYPLNFCIESGKNSDEIFGFKNKYSENKRIVNENSTLLDYLLNFLFKSIFNIEANNIQPTIKNELEYDATSMTFDFLKDALTNIEVRRELFENGKKTAQKFIEKLKDSV